MSKTKWHSKVINLVIALLVVALAIATQTAMPVQAAANFGYSSPGSTSYPTTNVGNTATGTNGEVSAELHASNYTTTVPLTAIQIKTYGLVNGSNNIKVSIYDHDAGNNLPENRLFPEVTASSVANNWTTITISNIYLPAGTYWLAYNTNTSGAMSYSSGSGTHRRQALTFNSSFPNPASNTWTSGTRKECIYFVGVPVEGYAKATKAILPDNNASITSMSFYSHATGNVSLAIYSSNGSAPSTLQWQSGSTAVSASVWNTVNISSGTPTSLTLQSGTYWLAWQWDSANSGPSYTAGVAGDGYYIVQAYGSFPSPWSGGTASTEKWSIYATYTAAPTVTTSVASSIEAATATLNGNVTATGWENPTVTVYWGDNDGGTTPGNWDSNSAPTSPSQPQGVASFYKDVTGLSPGTVYYFSAKATNSGGTSWGTTQSFTTKLAAPTDVSATDGTYTDKVVVTWTKSTGATGYQVYRDGAALGWLGDVATFDDTGAGAPSITPGTASASDGTYRDKVALSLSGTGTNNGTTHTYKVRAKNDTGESADSSTNTGYRGVGSLTYQWQRSAGDSDADYSDISGANTASYDDTGAPADGSGRYYRCTLDATGASQQHSGSDRGYRAVNQAPVANPQSLSVNSCSTLTVTLNGSDPDNDPLTYIISTLPTQGNLYDGTGTGGTNITSVPYTVTDGTHKVTYQPNASYNGTDSFGFKVNDGELDSAEATISVTVSDNRTTWYEDSDSDTYGNATASMLACDQPEGYVSDNTDCDDTDPDVNPGATEVPYNGKDDDCNPATPDAVYDLTLAVAPAGSGNATDLTNASPYAASTVVNITAIAAAGYQFANWTAPAGVFGNATAGTTNFTMPAQNVTIAANFEEIPPSPEAPTVTTQSAINSTTNSATLAMSYTVGNYTTVDVCFAYKKFRDSAWASTDWVSKSGNGTYAAPLIGLTSGTRYDFKAQLKYADTVIESTTLYVATTFAGAPGCFIATAAYGTTTAKQIDVLREFRDVVLLKSTAGSQFVALYYRFSPPIADFIAGNEFLRTLVRELLVDPIVRVVEATGDIWRN